MEIMLSQPYYLIYHFYSKQNLFNDFERRTKLNYYYSIKTENYWNKNISIWLDVHSKLEKPLKYHVKSNEKLRKVNKQRLRSKQI